MRGARQTTAGRPKQRARTKKLLLQTAGKLMRDGGVPTVTDVAAAADISRRTAYRYFPTQEQLLAEAALESLRPAVEKALAQALPNDVETRLEILVRTVQGLAYENEGALRTMLKLSYGKQLGAGDRESARSGTARGSRRIDWIETAVRPLRARLGRRSFERLVSALAVCIGTEAALILRDMRKLNPPRSIEVTLWTAKALLRAALNSPASSRRGRASVT